MDMLLATRKSFEGKPYAGNPRKWFDKRGIVFVRPRLRSLPIMIIAVGMSLRLFSATIVWEEAQNVGADFDVSTEGELVYAYNENNVDAVINGVPFKGFTTYGQWFESSQEPDVQLANFGEARNVTVTDFCPNFTASDTLSASYKNLLSGTAFNRGANTTATVTLLGLQPDEEYLVQVWINDSRQGGYHVVLDGTRTLSTNPDGTSYGQWCIGRFRADSVQQTISLFSARSPIINSIQVRKLSSIAWGEPQTIGDGSEVINTGVTLYAHHVNLSHGDINVNGVTFKSLGTLADNVRVMHNGAEAIVVRASEPATCMDMKSTYPEGTPEDYTNVVHSIYFAQYLAGYVVGPSWIDVTLMRLVPGRKYLVQLWYVDARYDAAECTLFQKVDGVRLLYAYDAAKGYRGQTVTGVFVAGSTNKTVRVRGYNANGTKNNPAFNALQVRDVTDVELFMTENTTVGLADETSVRNEGQTVYAYTAADSDLTVNGVTFTKQTSGTSWGDGNVMLSGFTGRSTTAFHTGTTPFNQLLAAGLYNYPDNLNFILEGFLTFNGLEPFKPHLIQVFIHDSRDATRDRRVKFGGQAEFVPYTNSAVYVFRPRSSSFVVNMQYTAGSVGNVSPQVNAVQVRRLAEPFGEDMLLWTGGSSGTWMTGPSGWTSCGTMPENPWSAEDGVCRDALVDSDDETMLTVGDGVTVRNLAVTGSLILNGLPTMTGEIMGGNVTVVSAWTKDILSKTRGGRLTLAGNRTALRQVVVNAGMLSLAANQQSSTIRRCIIGNPGVIELPEGVVQSVETVEGNGFVEGSGTFVVDCAVAKTVGGVWKDSVTLRKTGAGTLMVESVSSGTPILDVQSGMAMLTSDSQSPWVLNVATGAIIDLGGKSHLISGIYGSGTISNGIISGTVTNDGPVTVESSVSFAEGVTLVRENGEPITVDRTTFDLSTIAAIGFPSPVAFITGKKHVLRTTGTFTGTIPRLADGLRGYHLKIIPLSGGGHALRLFPNGVVISFR